MSTEHSPSQPYLEQTHRKLSRLLLEHGEFTSPSVDTLGPDGHYYQDGPIVVTDYLTSLSTNPEYAVHDEQARKEALARGLAIVSMSVEPDMDVTLYRPHMLQPKSMIGLVVPNQARQLGIAYDPEYTGVVMLDEQGPVAEPENHPSAPYIAALPDNGA